MKKIFILLPKIACLAITLWASVIPLTLDAQIIPPFEDYIPMAPIPGTTDGACSAANAQTRSTNCYTRLERYLPGAYKGGIAIAGILAVIVITYAGIEYMVSEAITSKEAAKKRIWNALGGLLLAFLSYLILYTLNPDLVTNLQLITPGAPVGNVAPPPPAGERNQLYVKRSASVGCEIRPDYTLVSSISTPGYACTQNPNPAPGHRITSGQVCCHWSGNPPAPPPPR